MIADSTTDPTSRPRLAVPDTHAKALALNLDPTSFGSFAEIGAGQEVARWFLNVGGASGSVAKTVSAYDKAVSDDLYGVGTRYVSKQRLEAMLDREWAALLHQMDARRNETGRFFAFADTIAARNFAGTNDCHGWVGARYRDRPMGEPSEILLHVNLRDNANLLQQEAVGILGVNLLHALLAAPGRAAEGDLPERLFDNLANGRIEVDQIEMRGSAFAGYDMPALHVALARNGRAEAVTVAADGAPRAANEFLYKKSVIIAPAASDPRDDLSPDAVAACVAELRREVAGNADVKDVIGLRLVTVGPDGASQSAAGTDSGAAIYTRHRPLFRTTAFIRRYTQAPLRFAMTLPAVMQIFDEARSQESDIRLLEGVARLFGHDVRVLAYPSRRQDMQQLLSTDAGRGWEIESDRPWIAADRVRPVPPLRHLYNYLLATGFLIPMPPPSGS